MTIKTKAEAQAEYERQGGTDPRVVQVNWRISTPSHGTPVWTNRVNGETLATLPAETVEVKEEQDPVED